MDALKDQVRGLIECTVRLSRSYAIWWELVNPEKKPKYEKVILDHEDFFAATAEAHFQLLCVGLYQLFDKRNGVMSIPNALKSIKQFNATLADALASKLAPNWGVLTRVFDIRGNVYAHRNASLDPGAVFARAGISPSALGSCVSLAEEITSTLAEACGIDSEDLVIAEFEHASDVVCDDIERAFAAITDR